MGFRTGNPLASKQTASDCRISGRAGGQARQVCVHGWCDCDQGGAGEGRAIADLVAAAAGRRGIADLVGRRGGGGARDCRFSGAPRVFVESVFFESIFLRYFFEGIFLKAFFFESIFF